MWNPVHTAQWLPPWIYRRVKAKVRVKCFYKQFMGKEDLVFDIGANVGHRVDVFYSLGARVVALEPVKSTFEELQKNCMHKAFLINAGASDHIGKGTINLGEASTICSMNPQFIEAWNGHWKWEGTEEIDLVTIDRLIQVIGVPRFIKIDVEGHEVQVLKGLSQSVEALSFEYTPVLLEPAFECIDILESLGTYLYNFSRGEDFKMALKCNVGPETIKELLKKEKRTGDVYAVRV